jgi:histone deacetylase complex regulatory component SIN3
LASDKPWSKKNTPYTEFLKCMHLFACGIFNKDELIMMLKDLFTKGHAPKSGAHAGMTNPIVLNAANDLLKDMEKVLVNRGPYAASQMQQARIGKIKSFARRIEEEDMGEEHRPTPSYRAYPDTFPHHRLFSHTGRKEYDLPILKDAVLLYPSQGQVSISIEGGEGGDNNKHTTEHEQVLLDIEDERFEVDMAIECNAHAMRHIEPFVKEVEALAEQEESEGQPVGRLHYELNRQSLNPIHINAIGRIYGDKADEVIQNLIQFPLIVLPTVYNRLQQMDEEWKKEKALLMPKWAALEKV